MILFLISLAMAQPFKPLPNEIDASRTCQLISEFYQKEHDSLEKQNRQKQKECEETKKLLPKKYQSNVMCIQFYSDESFSFVNTYRFMSECEKILSKINVRENLFGPIRLEDHCKYEPFHEFCRN